MSTVKVVILIALTMLMTPQLAMGVITFDQLSQDTFLVTPPGQDFRWPWPSTEKSLRKGRVLMCGRRL